MSIGEGPLLGLTVATIVVIILLIGWAKLHPLIALILGSAVLGIGSGLGAEATVTEFVDGLGDTIGDIGLLIALGAMLGQLLQVSGAATGLVDRFVHAVRGRAIPWAMLGIAFLIGLPLFFEVALVLVFPIIVLVVRRTGAPLLKVAIPALAALSLLNGFLPPHPGPLLAVSAFNADLGLTMLYGLIVAVPTVIIGGPLLGNVLARMVPSPPVETLLFGRSNGGIPKDGGTTDDPGDHGRGGATITAALEAPARPILSTPGLGVTLLTMLLPIVLMLVRAVAELMLVQDSPARRLAETLGQPIVALLAGCLLAMVTFGLATGMGRRQVSGVMGSGLPLVAGIILVVGAGGGFKGTLVATGVGDTIADLTRNLGLPALVLAWLLAALIRVAVGSGTVAIITAASLLAPSAAGMSPSGAALMALAVGAGSRFGSHINDAGFWMVKEFLHLDVKDTFRTWTLMDCVVSLVAGIGVVALGAVVE